MLTKLDLLIQANKNPESIISVRSITRITDAKSNECNWSVSIATGDYISEQRNVISAIEDMRSKFNVI
jgi:hypothetical protein